MFCTIFIKSAALLWEKNTDRHNQAEHIITFKQYSYVEEISNACCYISLGLWTQCTLTLKHWNSDLWCPVVSTSNVCCAAFFQHSLRKYAWKEWFQIWQSDFSLPESQCGLGGKKIICFCIWFLVCLDSTCDVVGETPTGSFSRGPNAWLIMHGL